MSQKHYLDTSVFRSFLLGTSTYKKFLSTQIETNNCYLSQFILMELNRSYLCNVIDFYFNLKLSTIPTVNEGIKFCANKFKGSELKAVLQFIGSFLTTRHINLNSKADKSKALRHLAMYIRNFEAISRKKFKDFGQDRTYCARGGIRLRLRLESASNDLKEFIKDFNDTKSCRAQCRIDKFVLEQFKSDIEKYIADARLLPSNNSTNGFKKISEELAEILGKGADACSCVACAKIGDAVIALNAPRVMRLEHTDNSFDYLCKSIAQPHQKHPSEVKIINASGNP